MELRDYQIECLEASENSQSNKQLVVLPTGTGKTVIFSELAKRRQKLGRVLILVHRDELVRQTKAKCHANGLKNVGVIKAKDDDVDSQITIASVQTLSRDIRMARYEYFGKADTLIIDEAHHAPARTYRDIITECSKGLVIGFTATPDRESQASFMRRKKHELGHTFSASMGDIFDELVYYRSLVDMIGEKWLVDLVPGIVETNMDLDKVAKSRGDWQDGALGAEMTKAHVEIDIVQAWKNGAQGRPTIAFLPTVETSKMVADEFNKSGIAAEHVSATTDLDLRQEMYKRLRTGETKVITNCMVLTEGFDEPSVGCIVVARPTQSRSLFAQMVGRGTRLHPGKSDCLVLSVVDKALDLSPVTLQKFLDLKGWKDGQKLTDHQKEVVQEAKQEQIEKDLEVQEAFIFVQAFKKTSRANLNWRAMGGNWRMKLGKEKWIAIVSDGKREDGTELWEVHLPNNAILPPQPIDGAVALAETWARENGGIALADPTAEWRNNKPSQEQIDLAQKRGITVTPEMTKGQIADAISESLDKPASPRQLAYAKSLGWVGNEHLATFEELRKWLGANAPKKNGSRR